MGGEEESSLDRNFPQSLSISSGDDDDEGLSHHNLGFSLGESQDMSPRFSSVNDSVEKGRLKVYTEVLKSYEELPFIFDEAKNKVLSYKPSSWAKKASGMGTSVYNVPNKTSLLIIGPKGSGKSSLVNKISGVLEDNVFLSERAQVSHNSTGDGTYFVRGYTIPRGSGSFCLYDTRSLSVDLSENLKMLKRWMTKGVRHGELVKRKSDSKDLKAQLRCNARRNCPSSQFTAINYVIFVVNGLSVLESMDRVEGKKKNYCEMIAANFNSPLLSFKDDRPVVVVTHGDLLSLSDRVRVRIYLGELLGVPPAKQIFDIPENNDSATRLAIVDMLTYCLERADWNLPTKKRVPFVSKVYCFVACLLVLAIAIAIGIFGFGIGQLRAPPLIKVVPFNAGQPLSPPPMKGVHIRTGRASAPAPSDTADVKIEWDKIRCMWLGDNYY
ncbi:hypothetical protein CASFOL_040222 [Castilleja foliolosa]|uniref:Uncharacterized protein n=1 Tax=Castilleja foliolosa TaxID=1961234 RepID=A0ABD3BEV2_9LAMI